MSTSSLKNRALNGVFWSAIDRFSSQGISFLISIVIARLLTPHDYGLVAMVGIFISIAQAFIDSGLSSAIVRKKDRTTVDLSTAFYANIIIGVLCYAILYLAAPYIARFYQEDELCSIVRIMGIIFFLFSFSNIQQAVLSINIDFKTKAKISLLSVIVSGTLGIISAYSGLGVWALVIQQTVYALLRTILLWIFVNWRPIGIFSWKAFCSLFSFGSKMLLTGLLNSIFNNLYSIVIGKTFSASSLGYYSRAEQFAQFPSSNMTNIVKGVTFPTMALIQDEKERLKANFYKIHRVMTFIIFPLIVGLASVASPLILLLLSKKWIYSAKLLQIICLALMWYPVYTQNLNFLEVKGYGGYILKSETISKIVSMTVLVILIPMGLEAICWGQMLSNIISVFVSSYFVTKITRDSYTKLFAPISMNLFSSLMMGIICSLAQKLFVLPAIQLVVGILVGGMVYLILNYCFNRSFLMTFYNILFKK